MGLRDAARSLRPEYIQCRKLSRCCSDQLAVRRFRPIHAMKSGRHRPRRIHRSSHTPGVSALGLSAFPPGASPCRPRRRGRALPPAGRYELRITTRAGIWRRSTHDFVKHTLELFEKHGMLTALIGEQRR